MLFVAVMTTGGLLKKPFGKNDDVMQAMETIKTDVTNEKWERTEGDLNNLKTAWKVVKKRIQFSVERDEMNLIDTNIARVEGALKVHDKSFIIIELSEMKDHWNELEK